MKVQYGVLALLALGGGSVSAQSSVTISGAIDLAVRRVDDGMRTNPQLAREGAGSSKLVFSGVEDMGGGLKAGFFLDSAVRADTGTTASTFWDRRSTVSLMGNIGELRLGRDSALSNSGPGDFDALNGRGVGNISNLLTPFNFSNATTFTRVSNAVSYLTPGSLKGFYGQFQFGPSEGADGTRYRGLSLGYKQGPLEARFTQGLTSVTSVASVNPRTGLSTVLPARGDFRYTVVGASYDFGVFMLMGSLSDFGSAKTLATGASRDQTTYNIGARVPAGSSGSVNFAFTRADRSGLGTDQQDATQFALQYMHRLSKRTVLYASAAHLKQDALAAADTAANGSRYFIDGTTVIGRSGTGLDFGIRHTF